MANTLVLGENNKIEIKNQTDESAELYFYGDICAENWQSEWYKDDQAPSDVADFLSQLDGVSTVYVHFNSGGGSVTGGIAIKNLLKAHPARMIGYVDGMAASIAGVILMACDEIHVYNSSIFMMHKPMSYVVGNADDMEKEIEVLNKCQEAITKTFLEKVKDGIEESTITDMINDETWLTGEQLPDYFKNIIVEESTQAAAAVDSNFFDKYKNVPEYIRKNQNINQTAVTREEIQKMIDNAISRQEEKNNQAESEKIKSEILDELDLI